MNPHNKTYKELQKQFTDEEIADGYMIPATLTDKEKEESDKEMRRIRFERLANQTEEQRLLTEVTRLRIKIGKYLKSKIFSQEFSFGKMLGEYVMILQKNKKTFAEDVDVHYTKLSRLLNDKEEPNISFMYRLEKHSDGIIPTVYWWKLMVRKQEYLIEQDSEKRKIEGERVKNFLKFSA